MKIRLKRILIGIIIGAIAGLALEALNLFLDLLFPPLLILTVFVLIAIPLAAFTGSRQPKQTHRLDQLPLAIAQYVELVVKKMRYRRHVRDDVRRELAAHFEDALADANDPDRRQALATELIAQFGDGKILATLIRRGKKRCRPIWKKAIVRSLQGAGVLILLFIAYTAWFMTGKWKNRKV